MNTEVMFSKASDEWRTPEDLFTALHKEFDFDVDAAAVRENRLRATYFGPDRADPDLQDALTAIWRMWGQTFWLNPPYSKCREFIAKAAAEATNGCTTVCLVPSRTDTRWWHDYVWDRDLHRARPDVEIRFLKGRLKFGGTSTTNSAPFPSAVVIFHG